MPITQSRMVALIAAAADFQRGLDSTLESIRRSADAVQSGVITKAEAFDNLVLSAEPYAVMADYAGSRVVLELEKRHFSHSTVQSNIYRAAQQALKRPPPAASHQQTVRQLTRAHKPQQPPATTAPASAESETQFGLSVKEMLEDPERLAAIVADGNADLESMDELVEVDGIEEARRLALDREIEEASKMLGEGGEEE